MSTEFIANTPSHGRGKFDSEYVEIVRALLNEGELRIQAMCSLRDHHLEKLAKKQRYGLISVPCTVSVIIYGPERLINEVGEFFQDVEMYLQDPKGCDMNTKYCNPHRLSSLHINDCPMTFELNRPGADNDLGFFQMLKEESDMLDIFDAHQNLPEAPQPDLIIPSLKRYGLC